MKSTYAKSAISLGITLAASISQLSYAQLILEEVVVTAQKRPESLVDAPLTVNVVSGEQIEPDTIFFSHPKKLVFFSTIRIVNGIIKIGISPVVSVFGTFFLTWFQV